MSLSVLGIGNMAEPGEKIRRLYMDGTSTCSRKILQCTVPKDGSMNHEWLPNHLEVSRRWTANCCQRNGCWMKLQKKSYKFLPSGYGENTVATHCYLMAIAMVRRATIAIERTLTIRSCRCCCRRCPPRIVSESYRWPTLHPEYPFLKSSSRIGLEIISTSISIGNRVNSVDTHVKTFAISFSGLKFSAFERDGAVLAVVGVMTNYSESVVWVECCHVQSRHCFGQYIYR